MEKYLGQEFADTVQREQFLRDNADAVENIGYAKDLPSEAVEKLKEKLAQATIKKMAVEDEKKEANKEFNDTIAGYKAEIADYAEKLKTKSEYVEEDCYRITDIEEKMTGYYNKSGKLVYERTALQSELQPNMFKMNVSKTGTNN